MLKQVIVLLFTIGMVCSALIDPQRQQKRISTKREQKDDQLDIETIIQNNPELRKIYDQLGGDKKELRDLARYAALTLEEREDFYKNGGVFPDEEEDEKKKTNGIKNALRVLGSLGGMATIGGIFSGILEGNAALGLIGGASGLVLLG